LKVLKPNWYWKLFAKKENITVSDEDVEKEMEKLSQSYGRKADELKRALEARGELEWFKIGIVSDRTIDMLVENNSKEKKEPGEQTENTDTGKNE
jgi:trigger factor